MTSATSGAAERERDRLLTLLAELGDGIVLADADDVIRVANPAAARLLAGTDLTGRRLVEVLRDHEMLEAVDDARRGRDSVREMRREGGRTVLRIAAKQLPGRDVLLTIQDESAVRRLETQRRDFVANVSHELRTPLAALKAMVETLRDGAVHDRDAAADFLTRIDHEVDGLADLVGDLLALSRMESGEEVLELTVVGAADLVQRAATRLEPLAARAQVQLATATDASGARIRVDPARMSQVLANLVHNAIKFTPAGGTVTVGTSATPTAVS